MGTRLVMTTLVENAPVAGLANEHGLSVHLSYRHDGRLQSILLDFGQTDAFARNADALGIDLSTVDRAVLSHAHYDHADGMPTFFARNAQAPLHLSAACDETCWSTKGGTAEAHYIGIAPGLLAQHAARIRRVPTNQATQLAPGVWTVPHTTPDLAAVGQHAGMLLREGDSWQPDDFAHELSLVVELGEGELVVLNSCSHAGLPVIVREVGEAFPGAHIAAYVGGLHLVHATDEEIGQVAKAVRIADVDRLYTGHCTGAHACDLLAQALPDRVRALHPGCVIEL